MSAPDEFQGSVIADLSRRYGWTHFAILAELTEYGKLDTADSAYPDTDSIW